MSGEGDAFSRSEDRQRELDFLTSATVRELLSEMRMQLSSWHDM